MQKHVQYIFFIILLACIAACGGSGTSTTAATPIYVVLPAVLAPANTHMGGAVQGGTISAKFSNYSVSTFAGVAGIGGFGNYSTTNGPPAKFNRPNDITTDGTVFYLADYFNNVIRKITSSGVVTTLLCTDAATGIPVGFNRPSAITTDGTNLYVVNSGSNTISFVDITTSANKVTTVGSTTGLSGSVDVKVVPPAITADVTLVRFNQPTGITTDGVNLYVTDSGNHTVRQIVIATKAVSTVAGTSGAIGSSDGIQGIARFNHPWRITTDGVSLYLTDFSNHTIRQIDISSGMVTTIAGSPGPFGTADGIGTTARFYQPNGITTDGTYLYVTDSFENTIRRINKIPPYNVATISGVSSGTSGVGGSVDSPGTPSFNTPIGITTDGTSLFIADTFNNTIRRIH